MSNINVYALNFLNLSHYYNSNINRSIVTQTLSLNQSIEVTIDVQRVAHHLDLFSKIEKSGPFIQPTISEISFTSTVTGIAAFNPYTPPTSNHITFTQSVSARKILSESVSNALVLSSGASAYKPSRNYISIDTSFPSPPIKITLYYGSYVIQMKAPEFDDVYKYQQERINRRTRGGDLEIFRDPNWPVNETLVYSFKDLKQEEAYNLLAFVEQSLGQYIILTDYVGYIWQGIITTPSKDIVQEGRKNYNASFEFIGTIIG